MTLVLVVVVAVGVVEVAVVEVVVVIDPVDDRVTAIVTVDVGVIFVNRVFAHAPILHIDALTRKYV